MTKRRESIPNLPFAYLTGDPGHYTDEELLKGGALAVLRKPFLPAELVRAVRELTARPGPPATE